MKRTILAAAAVLALSAPPASASDILMACEAEIANRCAGVNPGNGRLMSCLYAYEDQLDAACDAAMADTADLIDAMFAGLWAVKLECGNDMRTLCGDVPPGEGRLLSCLFSHRSEVSETCAALMAEVNLPTQ